MRWQSFINALVGLWFIVNGILSIWMSPVNFIIFGVILAVLGFWSAFKKGS